MQRLKRFLIVTLGLTLLIACAEPSGDGESPAIEPIDPAQEPEVSQNLPEPFSLDQAVEAARTDMVNRLSIPREEIEIIAADSVTWGDGSLGCPEPGMFYTQALVPGFFIHLRHGEKDAFYHAGRNGQPEFCPADRSARPIDPDNLT